MTTQPVGENGTQNTEDKNTYLGWWPAGQSRRPEAGCFSRPTLPAKPDFAGEVWPHCGRTYIGYVDICPSPTSSGTVSTPRTLSFRMVMPLESDHYARRAYIGMTDRLQQTDTVT